MPKIKLIVLDFDGVINELTPSKITAVKKLFKKLKIRADRRLIFNTLNYIEQIYETEKIVDYPKILSLVIDKLIKQGLININKKEIELFVQEFPRYLKTDSFINKKLLKRLLKIKRKKKLVTCLYTSQSLVHIKEVLGKSEKEKKLFDRIFTLQDFDEPKPSIKNLEKICHQLKINPKNGLMVGDNVAMDLMPAKFLGMKTVLYSKVVDYCPTSLDELLKVFSKI